MSLPRGESSNKSNDNDIICNAELLASASSVDPVWRKSIGIDRVMYGHNTIRGYRSCVKDVLVNDLGYCEHSVDVCVGKAVQEIFFADI